MAAIEEPVLSGKDNRALARWAMELLTALRGANNQLQALREWSNE